MPSAKGKKDLIKDHNKIKFLRFIIHFNQIALWNSLLSDIQVHNVVRGSNCPKYRK